MRTTLAALLLLTACDATATKGAEDDAPAEGKDDSHRRPTDHGDLFFGQPVEAELSAAEGFHAWTFALAGAAEIDAYTDGDVEVDTVLYLYRQRESGAWGPYVARNDDAGKHTLWSSLDRALGAGRYRVLVKGYTRDTGGPFRLTVECAGDGCAAEGCVFGETFRDLDERPALLVGNREVLTADSWLSDLHRQQVVLAVQQSSHTDVTTVEEAFARVDQQQINRVWVYEPAAARGFLVYEYGAGDNSYGAYFDARSTTIVASIDDGDLLGCATSAAVCALETSYGALLESDDFVIEAQRVVTSAAQVVGVDAEQLLASVREAYPEVADVEGALAAIDDGGVNVTTLRHRASGARVVAYEYGAGDNSYGQIHHAGRVELAAAINDGDLYGCTFLE